MTARSSPSDPLPPRPLSKWIIWAGTLVVLAVTVIVVAVSWFVLRRLYGGQEAQVQLDVIRTAGTLVIGTGGAVALLLTARRQRYTELALVHTDRDATERRITELYAKAADQLNSQQAPVRLAGLYALERLAHSTVENRQTIVDVICAYLRMPYTPPQPSVGMLGRSYRSPGPARRRRTRTLTGRPTHTMPTSQGLRRDQAEQERQVRLTAQNILSRNLRVIAQRRRRWWHRTAPPAVPAWSSVRLDLTGALLLEFSLAGCQLDYAELTSAQFTNTASFRRAQFTNGANFVGAQFTNTASFEEAQFPGKANFVGTQFTGRAFFKNAQFIGVAFFLGAQFTNAADFWGAQFTNGANFEGAQFTNAANFGTTQFTETASFKRAQFTNGANFAGAQFTRWANFEGAQFTDVAFFWGAQFTDGANFTGAQFTGGANFEGARMASPALLDSIWPPGWTTRPAQPNNGEDPAFLYLTRVEDDNLPNT